MSRSPWVRITLRGHEKDSWADLNIPAYEVVGGLLGLMGRTAEGSISLEEFYANGDGVKVTLERIPREKP